FQVAAYTGPSSIAYVESKIRVTARRLKKWQLQEAEKKSKEVEKAMAEEARAAKARTASESNLAAVSSAEEDDEEDDDEEEKKEDDASGKASSRTATVTSGWGPRARTEAAAKAVSKPVQGLSSTYREYAAALKEAGIAPSTTTPDVANGGGDTNTNTNSGANGSSSGGAAGYGCAEVPAAARTERFRRDLAAIVGKTRRQRPLSETYGLEELALRPPSRSQTQPSAPTAAAAATSATLSPPGPRPPTFNPLPLPPLPELSRYF
ncbi:unnamed protein product, partial [Scytosiphon promiscuus]